MPSPPPARPLPDPARASGGSDRTPAETGAPTRGRRSVERRRRGSMRQRTVGAGAAVLAAAVALGGVAPGAQAGPRTLPEDPVAYGTGGAAATQTADATAAAIKVLRQGGNAVDGAVAAA